MCSMMRRAGRGNQRNDLKLPPHAHLAPRELVSGHGQVRGRQKAERDQVPLTLPLKLKTIGT